MAAVVFAGDLDGSRESLSQAQLESGASVENINNVVLYTSTTYAAMLRDIRCLDPTFRLMASRKFIAVCRAVVRTLGYLRQKKKMPGETPASLQPVAALAPPESLRLKRTEPALSTP